MAEEGHKQEEQAQRLRELEAQLALKVCLVLRIQAAAD